MHAVHGPVFICCPTNNLYLNVIGDGRLRATSKKSDASEFYLKLSGNPKHPDEFYICYFGSSKHNQHSVSSEVDSDETDVEDVKRVPQCLQTPINIFGSNPGPLEFGYHIRDKETRLVLQSYVRKHHQPPVSLSAWVSGSEICFIQCARRRKKRYIAVKQSENSTSRDTCCVPSRRDSSVSTLFQIVQKWEARVDNLMKVKEPQFELHACTRPTPVLWRAEESDSNSIASNEEVPQEGEDDSEEVLHAASLKEHPKLAIEHKTIPKVHREKPS